MAVQANQACTTGNGVVQRGAIRDNCVRFFKDRRRGKDAMSWFYLALAIALEVAGTVCMKMSEGCTRLWLSAAMLVLYALGLGAMALALKGIEVSIAYALWTGVGLAIVAIVGMTLFKEYVSPLKLVSLALIVVGVVGLSYTEHKRPKCRNQEPGSLQLKTEESQAQSE